MTIRQCLLFLLIAITSFSCKNRSGQTSLSKTPKDDSVGEVYIRLYPSFINCSTIRVDRLEHVISFSIDSLPEKKYRTQHPFLTSLDNYEKLTQIESFYDTAFINLIRSKPTDMPFNDGISIITFLVKGDKIDTIPSGNNFPKALADNLNTQLQVLLDSAKDNITKKYLVDLKEYFR